MNDRKKRGTAVLRLLAVALPLLLAGCTSAFSGQDGMRVVVQLHEGKPLGISLPQQVVLEVVEADPVTRGQTAASSYKSAILENGLRVLVPPFIERGTKVIVSTDDGSYVKRAE